MRESDIVVVGGGPAGARAAKAAAEAGASVTVLEEHHEVGRPVQCAGLVTPRVMAHVTGRRSVVNEVRGSHFHSPAGHTVTIDAGKVKALVVDRAVFDREVASEAVRAGARFEPGSKVTGAARDDGAGGSVTVTYVRGGEEVTIRCRVLIGADGPNSVVRRSFGLPGPKETLTGAGAEVVCPGLEGDFVHIFAGNDVAPGFFAWLIPAEKCGSGDRLARVGLCALPGQESPAERLGRLMESPVFLAATGGVSVKSSTVSVGGGLIPLGPAKQTVADGVMLVGDAASMAKPTSGGGVYTGLTAGEICGRVAAGAVAAGDTSRRALRAYHREWMETFGRELKKGMTLRKAFMNLTDEKIEKAFDIIDDEKLISIIVKKGDIDYPVSMARAVLKKAPRLLTFAGPMLKALIFR